MEEITGAGSPRGGDGEERIERVCDEAPTGSLKFFQHVSEQEMVAAFLAAEVASPKWRKRYDHYRDKGIIDRAPHMLAYPDLKRQSHNELRAACLSAVRGYNQRTALFEKFPQEVEWYRGMMDVALLEFTIVPIRELVRTHNAGIEDVVQKMKHGFKLPPVIAVATHDTGPFYLIEGYTRAAAYRCYGKKTIDTIVGIADVEDWLRLWSPSPPI